MPVQDMTESIAGTPTKDSTAVPVVGGHISLGSKPEHTLKRMRDDGFLGAQIFASSPRTWRIPESREFAQHSLNELSQSLSIRLYLHAIYLINLASTDELIFRASLRSLIWTMEAGKRMGAGAVVVHAGSHRGLGFEAVRHKIVEAIKTVIERVPDGPDLLLENSAGGGGNIGVDFADIGSVIDGAGGPPGLGICLDTAHAYGAGYDLGVASTVDRMLGDIDAQVGMSRLKLIHFNDSKQECGSRRDRHENIGEGYIGREGFHNLLARSEIRRLPWILETPNLEKRKGELSILLDLCSTAERGQTGGLFA